jgi:hypothetical protein
MARPITWQNVNGPSLAEASAPMLAAQRSFDNAFGRIREDLDRRQMTEDKNWDVTKDNNTQAFMAELTKYKTPEELQAAQQSGALDEMRTRFGAQVDQKALNTATDLRPTLLQERTMRSDQYDATQQTKQFKPVMDAMQLAINQGDTDTFNRLLAENPTNPGNAAAQKAMNDFARSKVVAKQQDDTFASGQIDATNRQALAPGALAAQDLARRAGEVGIRASESSIKTQEEVRAAQVLEREAAARVKDQEAKTAQLARITKGTVYELGDVTSAAGGKAVLDALNANKDLDAKGREKVMQAINELAPGGKMNGLPVPTQFMLEAVATARDQIGPGDYYGSVETTLKSLMGSESFTKQARQVQQNLDSFKNGALTTSADIPPNTTGPEAAFVQDALNKRLATGGTAPPK